MGLLAGVSILSVVEFVYHLFSKSCDKVKNLHKLKMVSPTSEKVAVEQGTLPNTDHALYHLTKYFNDFMNISDIHGVRYTTDKNLSTLSRIFWTVTVVGSLVACSLLIRDSYRHNELNPVLVKVDTKTWNSNEIGFPTVTICPDLNKTLFRSVNQCVGKSKKSEPLCAEFWSSFSKM